MTTKRKPGRPPGPVTQCFLCLSRARTQGLCWKHYAQQRRAAAGATPRTEAQGLTESVAVRMSPALRATVDDVAHQQGTTPAVVLRRAWSHYLAAGAPAVVPEMADDE